MLELVDKADTSNLGNDESRQYELLGEMVRRRNPDWEAAASALQRLDEIAEEDEVNAIEVDGDLVEFLCAIENWKSLRESGDATFAARVAKNMRTLPPIPDPD